jgi:DNA-binding transcriptional LysR family regulator
VNNQISLADVRAFVEIAKAKNFTQAALRLACSRSQVSKQLVKLEQTLGVKLITRSTRTQRLTEQGQLLFEKCFRALDEIDDALVKVVDSSTLIQGRININCVGGYIGEEFVTELVNDFIQLYPNIGINLDFSSQRVDLIAGEFDLVFRMGHLPDSNLIARKLIELPVSTLASPTYIAKNGLPEHPRALAEHACITGTVKQWRFHRINQPTDTAEVMVDGQIQCRNGRAMIASALANNGIIRVPNCYCEAEIANGDLVDVFKHWRVQNTPIYLVYVKDVYQPARLQAFIDFALQRFQQPLGKKRML